MMAVNVADYESYRNLAPDHTENELAAILGVGRRTIRRYAQRTRVRPKVDVYRRRTLPEWVALFNESYRGRMTVCGPTRDAAGHVIGNITCNRCSSQWVAKLAAKVKRQTGCIRCDKGNRGNAYGVQEVTELLNEHHAGQWEVVSYGRYSHRESVIRCTLCGIFRDVNLADMINTTSRRCTNCQTGSFGEHVIRHTLRFNKIPFRSEVPIRIRSRRLRLDFLIEDRLALEYSGLQHFEAGAYFNEDINRGVRSKELWAIEQGYSFHEMVAKKTMIAIIADLTLVLERRLETPTAEFFAASDEVMTQVLTYMETHSARQTERDLQVSRTRIQRYIRLAGFESISAWQAENRQTHP